MQTIFKQLEFNRHKGQTWKNRIQDIKLEFFVPGVNSGIYKPTTLHIQISIEEKKAGFFNFTTNKTYCEATLSKDEFDELFAEMQKIKKLRDAGI